MGGSTATAASTAMTRSASGYARYIGRVGGLAFALGVGAALLTGQAVASAETTDAGTSDTQASSSQQSGTGSATSKTTSKPASKTTSTAESDDDSDDASGEADASGEDAGESEQEPTGPNPDQASDSDDSDGPEGSAGAAELGDDTPESGSAATDTGGTPEEPPADGSDGAGATDGADPAADPAPAEAADPAPTADTDPATAAPPSARATATAAADPPSFWETLFSNTTPTLNHVPAENETIEGQIEGNLHPEDPDSTRLTYSATDPAHGEVQINDDGTFVYTPGPTYLGQDSFQVTVSDARSGFHIHGLAGLLNLVSFGLIGSSGHRSTETVFIGFDRAVVASGLNSPVDFRFLPDGRIVVAEKGGAIKVVEDGVVREQPLITLSVSTTGERGISGLAVDPHFADNGRLYVAYTTTTLHNRLSRLTVVGNSAGSELVLLESAQTEGTIHHGGALGFGPDGTIYWGVGDNGTSSNAQNLQNLHGKILRLNPDGTIPAGNPDLGLTALPQIYAYGLRNPFRLTFTPDGRLLVADVGNAAFEEVNVVTAGGNYGWPGSEGVCTSNCSGKTDPIYTYPRGGGAAITSVLVYTGDTFGPSYLGKVFIADTVQGWIRVLTCTPQFTSCGDAQDFDAQAGATVMLLQGPDGNVYQLTYQPGRVVRISPAGDAPTLV